jgi:hypothetical protein
MHECKFYFHPQTCNSCISHWSFKHTKPNSFISGIYDRGSDCKPLSMWDVSQTLLTLW